MSSWTGIVQNRAWLSIELWSCVIALISNRGNWHRVPSASGLAQYDVSHTKRPIAVSSSADLAAGIRRVKGVKKIGVHLGNWLTAEQAVDGDKAFYGALIFVDFQISRPILDITALAMNNRLLQASLSRREIG